VTEVVSTATTPADGQQIELADGSVLVSRDGAVLTVTLNNATNRNAQTPQMWRAMASVGTSLPLDVRAVILRADGPSFSAGLDRRMFTEGVPGEKTLIDMVKSSTEEFDAIIAGYQEAFTCWRNAHAVTVALVQGHAVGAGFQLALGADIMIVADDVKLCMKETQLGLVPDLAGTQPLLSAVGYSRALEICATGRWVEAEEAVALGIALSSHPVGELEGSGEALIAEMLTATPGALIETKSLLRDGQYRDRDSQIVSERVSQRQRINELGSFLTAP